MILSVLSQVWALLAAHWTDVVAALVLPLVVQAIAGCTWSANVKGWLAFGVSALYGVGGAIAASQWLPDQLAVTVLAVFGGMTVAYRLFRSFKVTNALMDYLLQAFGGATVPASRGVRPRD